MTSDTSDESSRVAPTLPPPLSTAMTHPNFPPQVITAVTQAVLQSMWPGQTQLIIALMRGPPLISVGLFCQFKAPAGGQL